MTNTTTTNNRANRVSVQTIEGTFTGTFYRTHKKLITITESNTDYKRDDNQNSNEQREAFRAYLIANASDLDINYDPTKQQPSTGMVFPRQYDTDSVAMETGRDLVAPIINEWMDKIAKRTNQKITIDSIEAEAITPLDKVVNGVIDGKYEKNGCWAWAEVEVVITVTVGQITAYAICKPTIKSGQMSKPKSVGGFKFTQTGLQAELSQDIESLKVGLNR